MEITTADLVLAELTHAHAEPLAGLLEEPELREWLRAGDVDALRERFRGWETRRSPDGSERWLNWIVLRRADGEALGWLQAAIAGGRATVAYVVLPRARGAGVAAAAVGALAARLSQEPGVDVVDAVIDPANAASRAVARRAGFSRTGDVRGGEDVWELRPR